MNNKKSDKRAGEKQKKEILFRTNLFIYLFWLVLTQTKPGQQQNTDRRAGKKWNKRPKKISMFFFFFYLSSGELCHFPYHRIASILEVL